MFWKHNILYFRSDFIVFITMKTINFKVLYSIIIIFKNILQKLILVTDVFSTSLIQKACF